LKKTAITKVFKISTHHKAKYRRIAYWWKIWRNCTIYDCMMVLWYVLCTWLLCYYDANYDVTMCWRCLI